jgi:hypothetical protein
MYLSHLEQISYITIYYAIQIAFHNNLYFRFIFKNITYAIKAIKAIKTELIKHAVHKVISSHYAQA